MGSSPGIARICLCILFLTGSANVVSQDKIGQVTETEGETFIMRSDEKIRVTVPTKDDPAVDAWDGDILKAEDDSFLEVNLENITGNIEVAEGSLEVLGPIEEPVCHVIEGIVRFEGKTEGKGKKDCCKVLTDDVHADCEGTKFEVHVKAYNTFVIVHEGSVKVTSKGVKNPKSHLVPAGYWVNARYGEQIPPPYRFSWADAADRLRAGSTQCIYSNCKEIDNPTIPSPPIAFPKALVPPPPNPPGQR